MGKVLAASPKLADPNFSQTLVFIAEHNEAGAFGLVLNRPMGRTLAEVMPEQDLAPSMAGVPVHYGGPVRPNNLLLAVFEPGAESGRISCKLDANLEQAEAYAEDEANWVRAFVGYSGWGEGQLEGELSENAWKVCPSDPVIFKQEFLGGLWSVYISGDETWRKLLPHLPRDPSRN